MNELPEIMTSHEVAAYLRLSPKNGWQSVQSWAREKKIDAVKIGDLWRFPKESVLRFVEKGRRR